MRCHLYSVTAVLVFVVCATTAPTRQHVSHSVVVDYGDGYVEEHHTHHYVRGGGSYREDDFEDDSDDYDQDHSPGYYSDEDPYSPERVSRGSLHREHTRPLPIFLPRRRPRTPETDFYGRPFREHTKPPPMFVPPLRSPRERPFQEERAKPPLTGFKHHRKSYREHKRPPLRPEFHDRFDNRHAPPSHRPFGESDSYASSSNSWDDEEPRRSPHLASESEDEYENSPIRAPKRLGFHDRKRIASAHSDLHSPQGEVLSSLGQLPPPRGPTLEGKPESGNLDSHREWDPIYYRMALRNQERELLREEWRRKDEAGSPTPPTSDPDHDREKNVIDEPTKRKAAGLRVDTSGRQYVNGAPVHRRRRDRP